MHFSATFIGVDTRFTNGKKYTGILMYMKNSCFMQMRVAADNGLVEVPYESINAVLNNWKELTKTL